MDASDCKYGQRGTKRGMKRKSCQRADSPLCEYDSGRFFEDMLDISVQLGANVWFARFWLVALEGGRICVPAPESMNTGFGECNGCKEGIPGIRSLGYVAREEGIEAVRDVRDGGADGGAVGLEVARGEDFDGCGHRSGHDNVVLFVQQGEIRGQGERVVYVCCVMRGSLQGQSERSRSGGQG